MPTPRALASLSTLQPMEILIMQAIRTKYRGPTDRTGSRIVASSQAGRVIMPYAHELNLAGNHRAAAEKLANKFGWLTPGWELAGGGLPDGSVAHVLTYAGKDTFL